MKLEMKPYLPYFRLVGTPTGAAFRGRTKLKYGLFVGLPYFRLVGTPTGAAFRGRCLHRSQATWPPSVVGVPTDHKLNGRPQAKWLFALFVCLLFYGCHSSTTDNSNNTPEVRTPVTVTSVSHFPLKEYIQLNATSTYIQQNYVKSNLNGYIQKSNIKFGDYVHAGQALFILKTKEASAIGNAVNQLDSSFKFSGVNTIRAGASGYVMQLNHQQGDYVQDGEQLAVISNANSFAFVMNVPYEDKPYVAIGKHVLVILPDSVVLDGTISSSLPLVDSVTQTQSYSIKVNAGHTIPENLIATVKILKRSINDAETLPKSSVLSDVTQTKYWVMKMINDSTAVKVPVETGIEKGDTIQIVSPHFSTNAKILSGGNYGLSDTAFVTASADSSKGGY